MSPERKKLFIGYLCGFGAVVFWGVDTVIIRWIISKGVDPFVVSAMRLYIGSGILAVLSLILFAARRNAATIAVQYTKFFWIITLSLAVNFLLFHKGLSFTIASDAVLLEAFSPVMVLLLVMLFLPERLQHIMRHYGLSKKILKIVIIGSIGSSLILINDPKDLLIPRDKKFIGDLMEFIAMFAWALVMLGMHEYQKRGESKNVLSATAQILFCAAIIVTPFAAWSNISAITQEQWIWILLLGIFSTAVPYILWHLASRYLDIFPLITFFNFVSIFTVITESIVLNLTISWQLIIGGALILYAAGTSKVINTKYKIIEKEEMGAE